MRKPLFALNLPCRRPPLCILTVAASLTLASCTTILTNLPGVYSIDVQQGNMIDQGMVDQLRPAMNKRQVLYIMGSPMLADFFHQDRWDYLYSAKIGGDDRQQKRISLFFNNDQLTGIQGDFKPSAVPVVKVSEETTVDVPKRDIEKSLWEMITGLFGFDIVDDAPKADAKASTGTTNDQLPL